MFVAAKDISHVAAPLDRIVAIIESINTNVVAIPGYDAQPTQAYIVGVRNPDNSFSVYIYLYLREGCKAAVYMCEPRAFALARYSEYEGEAIVFVESMGFMVDNLNFRRLPAAQQNALVQRIPAFHQDLQRFASYNDDDVDVVVGGELLELEQLDALEDTSLLPVQDPQRSDNVVGVGVPARTCLDAEDQSRLVSLLASF